MCCTPSCTENVSECLWEKFKPCLLTHPCTAGESQRELGVNVGLFIWENYRNGVWREEVSKAVRPFRQAVLEACWQLKCNHDLSLTLTQILLKVRTVKTLDLDVKNVVTERNQGFCRIVKCRSCLVRRLMPHTECIIQIEVAGMC